MLAISLYSHPAARLKKLTKEYHKYRHGALITQRIGLRRLREECRHFNEWVTRLESLGSLAP